MRRYTRIGCTHIRRIPSAWFTDSRFARVDLSLDAITDPLCEEVAYDVGGLWQIRISTEELRRALETHPWRSDMPTMMKPFNIDVAASTVAGKPVRMNVVRLDRAA